MRSALRTLLVCGCSLAAQAQAPAPAGMPPEWDIKAILLGIAAHAGRVVPVLNQIDAKSWVARGASETYAAQLQSSKEQAKAVEQTAKALAERPEQLAPALELYIRITALERMVGSLEEGIRRYQNPALAEMVHGVISEDSRNQDIFQRYIVEMANQRESQFSVMDKEAQQCRSIMLRQPVDGPRNPVRKK
jgi:hypothetical protein